MLIVQPIAEPTVVRPPVVRPAAARPDASRPTAVRPTAVRPTADRRSAERLLVALHAAALVCIYIIGNTESRRELISKNDPSVQILFLLPRPLRPSRPIHVRRQLPHRQPPGVRGANEKLSAWRENRGSYRHGGLQPFLEDTPRVLFPLKNRVRKMVILMALTCRAGISRELERNIRQW